HGGGSADAWEWDGSAWRDITPQLDVGRPASRTEHSMAFDENTGEMVLQGGFAPGLVNETWVSRSAAEPTVRFTVALPPELRPSRPLGGAGYINDLRVRASCGGSFRETGQQRSGSTLYAWRWHKAGEPAGFWDALATNAASVTSPTLVEYRPLSDVRASEPFRFIFNQRRLAFECRPASFGDSRPAEVALDYAEIRLGYDSRCIVGFDNSECPNPPQ
ncbi:MAG: hypothetical protein AAF658_22600, partial [Myxococcota bacterium]